MHEDVSLKRVLKNTAPLLLSVADLPWNIPLKTLAPFLSSLPIDGVELVVGVKTRGRLRQFAKEIRYVGVPIRSIHQPLWTSMQLYYDESAFRLAKLLKVPYTAHPAFQRSLYDRKTQQYFHWLNTMSKKYDVQVSLENMPKSFTMPLLKTFFHADSTSSQLSDLKKMCHRFQFGLTFDTSHIREANPERDKHFASIFPYITNIHLSDFTIDKQHLALGEGLLAVPAFLLYLKKNKYCGLLTLELSPRLYERKHKYLHDITRSVDLVRSIFDA